jgi:tetratricopeptide (TPR) repeat protein
VILTLFALAAVQATPAAPAANSNEARFATCSALARSAPDRAVEAANSWRLEGGGLYARQCLGLAYVALGRWAPAATVYEQAAREAETAQDPRRADLWAQSGNAWLAADQPAQAVQAFDAALAIASLSNELRGEVHLDRGRALVALGNVAGARTDINRALQLVPGDPLAWYLSAALARRENNLPRAQSDIATAIGMAPNEPDIILLAGTIAGLSGNSAEAERRYRQVAALAPQSEAGRAAAAALASERDMAQPAPAAQRSPPRPAPAPATPR